MDIDRALFEGITILYAEDDEVTRTNIAKTLGLLCAKVTSVENGEEAVEAFRKCPAHIVILDYVMPCMDGLRAAQEIREISPNVPIFMTSGHMEKEKLLGVMSLGLVDYLEKPLDLFILLKTLAKCLEKLHENKKMRVMFPDGVVYDGVRKAIGVKGVFTPLTKKEAQLLDFLLENHCRMVPQEEIEAKLYGGEEIEQNTLRNLVYRLRQKCGQEAIKTLKGRGYSICASSC